MAYSGDAYKVLETSPLSSSVQNAMIDNIYQSLNTLDTGKASTAAATTSTAGLMSAADKVRLNALELAALTIASIESY